MIADVIEQPFLSEIFFSADGCPGDKRQDSSTTNNQGENEKDKKYRLAIGIVSYPSLQITYQDGATDQTGKCSGESIDEQGGPEFC